ncbi:MAG: A24 family peptidase [Gemmatimonadota bacterium]
MSAVGLVMLVGAAAATDVAWRRIPNALTIAGLCLALGLRALQGGPMLVDGLLGAAMGFVVSFPLFALGGMGGGDVKLITAVGAFLGPLQLTYALLATALIGGLFALIVAARRGALRRVVRSSGGVAATLLAGLAMRADLKSLPTLETEDAIRIPYGVPIALGAVFGLVA